MHACIFHLLRDKTGPTGSAPTSPPSASLLIGPSAFEDAVGGNVSNSVAVQDGLRGSDERLAKCSGLEPLCVTSCVSVPHLQQPVPLLFAGWATPHAPDRGLAGQKTLTDRGAQNKEGSFSSN